MSSAPPPVANSGEDVITREVDVQPELFADESVPLEEAYEVEETLKELEGYSRVTLALEKAIKPELTQRWTPDCTAIP